MERVITYIDGFNLYFGLKEKKWRRYYWLDVKRLAETLLQSGQTLVCTKYFTSRMSRPADKVKRQTTYIEALQTLTGVELFFGKYQINDWQCRKCGHIAKVPNEKMTDVNIAVEVLADAFQDRFDTAFLISADTDLTAPLLAVKRIFPAKRLVAAFPPERFAIDLTKVVDAYLVIGRARLAQSQLPEEIIKPDGFVLKRPASWK